MATKVRSHAKINLGLGIGAPRSDGFHYLCTVYQTLELHDAITVDASPAPRTSIQLTSNDPRVPTNDRNTAWKMVTLALAELGVTAAVNIHIEKHLPVQGGLGAGSANAIASWVGLDVELKRFRASPQTSGLNFPQFAEKMGVVTDPEAYNAGEWPARQIELAARVGSDVPLFLVGGLVLGRDRGQAVFPLPDFEATWCLVAAPALGVSTPQAFRDWDALCARESLTAETSDDRLEQLSRAYVDAFSDRQKTGSSGVLPSREDLAGPKESALVRTGITSWIENDFERVVFPQHPILCDIKRLLAASGTPEAAVYASLSGSGSALFGLYRSREHAEAAMQRLAEVKQIDVRTMITRTIPRSTYWSRMLL